MNVKSFKVDNNISIWKHDTNNCNHLLGIWDAQFDDNTFKRNNKIIRWIYIAKCYYDNMHCNHLCHLILLIYTNR
jgi:hypothetical protein